MKKLCAVFAAVMTAATVWLLFSCGTDPMKNVSERRGGYYTAGDAAATVTAVTGVRETDYKIDGTVGALKPYTLITVSPAKFDVDAVYTYTAKTSSGEYGGALVVHPFAASFSAEFDAETTDSDFVIKLTVGGATQEYSMKTLVTADMISYDRAIDAARSELDPDGSYEIRARLIKNPIGGEGLCWHVAFYFADGASKSVLLDPTEANVIAVKR